MRLLLTSLLAVLPVACQKPQDLAYRIAATRPHDSECYTQGLEFAGGRLFESSGGYGVSTVREVDPVTGKVLRKRPIAKHVFAEGITVMGDEMWVLTWEEQTAYVLEAGTFKFLRNHHYDGEGWGLTNDGKLLIMSDGTSTLRFIDPVDFSVKRRLTVTADGKEVTMLNELEHVDGVIYANIYLTDRVAIISAETGKVTGWLDLSPLRKRLPQPNRAEVLNGIAHQPRTGRLLVTGKQWPQMFELEIAGQ